MKTLGGFNRGFFLRFLLVVLAGCGGGGGGGGSFVPNDRIGRGVPQPTGDTVTITLQEGVGGYAGESDYKTGSTAPANLLEIEIASSVIISKTYIRYDLTSAGIPGGAQVVSASLTFTVYRENGCGQGSDFLEARHLTQAWTGSGDRTYYAPPNPADGVLLVPALPDGGGADPNVLDTPQPIVLPVDAVLVQNWIDAPANNNGVAIVPSTGSNGMQLHFFSSAESTDSYRPKLTITYTTDTNQPPTASVSALPTTGNAPLEVTFTGSGTDTDGYIKAYRYDFDDGGTAFTASPKHTYNTPGTYFVNFTVMDDKGKMASKIVVITVNSTTTPAQYPGIGFHPKGGEPPASGESVAPGMTNPLPSSRHDTLVWHDQLDFNQVTDIPQAVFAARNTVGSQKMPQSRIEVVRAYNSHWRVLQYHLAYGLTRGADWTDKNVFADEKIKFDAWMSAHSYGNTQLKGLIINSPLSTYASNADSPDWDTVYGENGIFDNSLRNSSDFYYCDPGYNPGGGSLWQHYISDETVRRMQMNDAGQNFDGTFFDTSHEPGPNLDTYCGASAWQWYTNSDVCTIATSSAYADWWNARVSTYYAGVKAAYSSGHRYIVIPNSNRMLTNWYEPTYLNSTDGAFVESFACTDGTNSLVSSGAGVWETSFERTLKYITGPKRMLLACATPDVSSAGLRMFCIASFLLVKNDTSYYTLNSSGLGSPPNGYSGNPEWFPEFEIDIGSYLDDCPTALDDLRVAGSSGGGLYARWYTGGLVLANSSPTTTYDFDLDTTYYPVNFSGGGWVQLSGAKAAQTLTTGGAVSGTYSVPPNTGRILRASPLP